MSTTRTMNENELETSEDVLTQLITSDTRNQAFWAYLNQLLNGQPEPVSTSALMLSYSLQTGALSVGALSGLPYIAPAVQFAGQQRIYGYFLGYGIFASLGVVEAWAMRDVVKSMTSRSSAEKALLDERYSVGREMVYWISVPALGAAAAYSVATLIYKFNGQSVPYFALSMFTDIITNTASLNRFYVDIKYELRRYISSEDIRAIESKRRKWLHCLEVSIERLPSLSRQELLELIRLKRQGDMRVFFNALLKLSRRQISIEEENKFWFNGLPKQISNVISAVFPLAWAIFGLINSYTQFNLLVHNAILCWIISTATNFPYLFLELTLACSLVNFLYDMAVGSYHHTFNPSMPRQFYPKSYALSILLGLFTTANAFGARARFVTSEIAGGPGIALAVIVCISTIAYKSAAMVDIIRTSFEEIAKRYGHEYIKELVGMVHALQRFSGIIHDASSLKIAPFLNELEELVPTPVTTNNKISFWCADDDKNAQEPSLSVLTP